MEFYTIGELVKIKNCNRATISRACLEGDLKAQKMPGKTGAWMIDKKSGDRWEPSPRGRLKKNR